MKVIANDTWGLEMQWIKNGDNKWQGVVTPIWEDTHYGEKEDSELIRTPNSLADPADGQFRGNATVQTRCFDGRRIWADDGDATGVFILPYVLGTTHDASDRGLDGWKFDTQSIPNPVGSEN